jgi:hypothetical protein
MEKTLEIHLQEQQNTMASLLAKYSIEIMPDNWFVPSQVALDIASGKIKE